MTHGPLPPARKKPANSAPANSTPTHAGAAAIAAAYPTRTSRAPGIGPSGCTAGAPRAGAPAHGPALEVRPHLWRRSPDRAHNTDLAPPTRHPESLVDVDLQRFGAGRPRAARPLLQHLPHRRPLRDGEEVHEERVGDAAREVLRCVCVCVALLAVLLERRPEQRRKESHVNKANAGGLVSSRGILRHGISHFIDD